MNGPPTMTVEMSRLLARLTEEKRHAVLERAAIVHESNPGMSWPEADEQALVLEGVVAPKLPGVSP